ncbi:MAG: hypothetical protein JSR72_01730 [Proteobacteria bacterium]|nr:hypothetical protein [Pseudomonadota bacterium]
MALSERREPTFHAVGRDGEAPYPSASHHGVAAHHPVKPASHFTRFVSGFQAISTLIGVPIALASGYSLYRANFAPETACANLRASIVQMLDKNVDAATRRMLVKRDIESFEQSCGAVDPDAHAAFKTLLEADKPAVVAAKPQAVAKVPAKDAPKPAIKEPVKEAAREPAKETKDAAKTELRPAIADKKPATAPQAVAVAPDAETHPGGMSDTRWLDAVRSALVDPPAERKDMAPAPVKPAKPEVAKAEPKAEPKNEPMNLEAARHEQAKAEPPKPEPVKADPGQPEPVKAELKPVVSGKPGDPVLQPAWSVNQPPAAPPAAAPLPPAVEVAAPPEPARSDDHPVPPGTVPSSQYATDSSWVGKIPFVGRMIDR